MYSCYSGLLLAANEVECSISSISRLTYYSVFGREEVGAHQKNRLISPSPPFIVVNNLCNFPTQRLMQNYDRTKGREKRERERERKKKKEKVKEKAINWF